MKKMFSVWLAVILCAAVQAQTQRPVISGIKAEATSTTQITVAWQLPKLFIKTAAVTVYRSTEPIAGREAIKQSVPIAELAPGTTSFIDTVPIYREYYYAVVLSVADNSPYDLILPSINSTVTGIRPQNNVRPEHINGTAASAKEKVVAINPEDLRQQPLPFLNILPKKNVSDEISSRTEKAAVSLGRKTTAVDIIEPYVFRNDKIKTESGEDSMLYDIVQTYFIPKQYAAAVSGIQDFLQIKRGIDITHRSTFYLGEAYYYLGEYRKALTAFLKVQDVFPELATRWLHASLEAYVIPESD